MMFYYYEFNLGIIMRVKYEINVNSTVSKELPDAVQEQLGRVILCVKMIGEKIKNQKVQGKLDTNTDEVTLVLFNNLKHSDADLREIPQKNLIDLLRTFDVKIYKEPFENSFYSYTRITVPYQKIESIIKSLALLEDIPKDYRIAKC